MKVYKCVKDSQQAGFKEEINNAYFKTTNS